MLNKKRLRAFVPLALFLMLLLFAGIFAITQEAEDSYAVDDNSPLVDPFHDDDEEDEEALLVWTPLSPPRWFRSNAGGMALEETPSRLAALRNKYALVIDYIPPEELEPRLSPFYEKSFNIEIRILYNQGEESRRQWLFRDNTGNIRLNAVFRQRTGEQESVDIINDAEDYIENNIAYEIFEYFEDIIPVELPVIPVVTEDFSGDFFDEFFDDAEPDETPAVLAVNNEPGNPSGFIEIFSEDAKIIKNYQLFEGGEEILTVYFYNKNVLTKTETSISTLNNNDDDDAEKYRVMYADTYRYNRAHSLRYVERFYHAPVEAEPLRLSFSHRVLDIADGMDFFTENVTHSSDFMDNYFAGEGFRMVYDTDSRGRILSQTMTDDKNKVIWIIKNTWAADRIVSTTKIEGDEERLTEYVYDGAGNRVVQRDIRNGVLERQIFSGGVTEVEELFLNGVVVLRAYWENGRKIREERVRRQ